MDTPVSPGTSPTARRLLDHPLLSPVLSADISFENLVALANAQERIKDARKIVWRDRGEPVVDILDLYQCLEHAGKGGLRAAGLGFSIRAAFNVFLALIKLRKVPRAQWFALVRHAIFGTDSLRFAAMLGTFAALYKFLINALPIIFPPVRPSTTPVFDNTDENSDSSSDSGITTPGLIRRRAPRLSLSAHARMILVRKPTRRWMSALAGAISGGLAILWEKRSRRVVIAQQVFVRGLQGSYNFHSEQLGFSIPYGDVLVFSLACGQIMYAFFLRPDSLPRSYVGWIQEASKASPHSFVLNRKAVYEHVIDIPSLDRLIERPDITPGNLTSLRHLRERALAGAADLPRYVPCAGLHPMADSCKTVAVTRFFEVARWMLPIYTALHFVPSLLLRWRSFRTDPASFLTRVGVGSLRSSAFLGAFVIICEGVLCSKHKLYEWIMAAPTSSPLRKLLPQGFVDLLISKGTWWLSGFATGLALFIEDRRRRAELAMYVLPKGLESLWVVARGHGLIWHTGNWGEGVLAGVGMAMVMVRFLPLALPSTQRADNEFFVTLQTTYQNDPQHLSGLVRKILYQFIGPN
ncbi:hypothetical protein MSAN_01924700 [Mycena sanguinolenta]|uniref:Transmembrane protein 135 N-terminal domain-containing protein n=1 Tax=Mycena sanguinolenta TaxID=230812 RepID=A0A8H6XQD5_9AGAR|nr:hypothetical protein MSAN_01924700 [Mycena sanguinolenta]